MERFLSAKMFSCFGKKMKETEKEENHDSNKIKKKLHKNKKHDRRSGQKIYYA